MPQLKDPAHCNEDQGSHVPPLGPKAVKSMHTISHSHLDPDLTLRAILHTLKSEHIYNCKLSDLKIIIDLFQFSRSFMSSSLQPHGLQHARPPGPLPTPEVHPNPCPLSW